MKEHCIEVWKKPEADLTFGVELKKNVHAQRAPYRVLPADLRQTIGVNPAAFGAILRVYEDGIEVGTVRGDAARHTKWLVFSAFMFWSLAVMTLYGGYSLLFDVGFMLSLMCWCSTYFCFCFGAFQWRLAFHQPADDPVLFCRQTRMVYIRPYIMGGFFDFWKKGTHGAPQAYRWDDQIRARIYSYIYHRGAGLASEGFELALLAIREGTASEVELLISLGTQANSFDSDQLALWEHIRQYMEEGGPALQPKDQLRKTDLNRLPTFPAEILAGVGGAPLDAAGIQAQINAAVAKRG